METKGLRELVRERRGERHSRKGAQLEQRLGVRDVGVLSGSAGRVRGVHRDQ